MSAVQSRVPCPSQTKSGAGMLTRRRHGGASLGHGTHATQRASLGHGTHATQRDPSFKLCRSTCSSARHGASVAVNRWISTGEDCRARATLERNNGDSQAHITSDRKRAGDRVPYCGAGSRSSASAESMLNELPPTLFRRLDGAQHSSVVEWDVDARAA